MTIDRRFSQFRLIKQHENPSRGEGKFMYNLVVQLGGDPEKNQTRWLTLTEVAKAAKTAHYETLLDPTRGNVKVPDSVYYWLNKWSREGFMERN